MKNGTVAAAAAAGAAGGASASASGAPPQPPAPPAAAAPSPPPPAQRLLLEFYCDASAQALPNLFNCSNIKGNNTAAPQVIRGQFASV